MPVFTPKEREVWHVGCVNDLMKWVCAWMSEDDERKKSFEGRSEVSSEKRGAKARQGKSEDSER